ncbi:MAG: cell wall-binding repeat-containing protein [Bacillota bacterium]
MKSFRLYITTIFMMIFLAVFFVQPAFAEEEVQLLIKYNEGSVQTLSSATHESSSVGVIKVPRSEVGSTLKGLNEKDYIQYAEIDAPVYTQSIDAPNDPRYAQQKPVFDIMKVKEAWGKYDPKQEVTVAVIDSGIDLDHPDLALSIIEGKNILNPMEPPTDNNGHGTHVAGLVGAVTNNEEGISSLARSVKIMPIKVVEQNEGMISSVISGIEYAMTQDVDIINISLGSYTNSLALRDTVQQAIEQGIIIVAAAGNHDRNDVMYPAKYPDVLSVGSMNGSSFEKAEFSNHGMYIDVVTPGTNVLSTWVNGDYHVMEGTSMSAGMVSSLAAMILQQSPYLSNRQVKGVIESSTSELLSTYSLGSGIIDASASLDKIKTNNRIFGPDSVQTAVEISKYGWNELETNSVTVKDEEVTGKFVVLATGDTFADSLAASPLGTHLNSPIHLVKKSKLTEEVKDEMARLGASHVVIIGGEKAISSNVESELKDSGYETVRIFGDNRYETAIAVNKAVPYETNKTFVVSGEDYPDALSIAPYSGIRQYPILFVRKNSIDQAVLDYIEEEEITKSYIIGGETPVSAEVEEMLPAPFRIAGDNRYETNYAVQNTFGDGKAARLFFTTGINFPDALTAAPLAAQTKSPVILTPPAFSEKTKKSILLYPLRSQYTILGGKQAIDQQVGWELDRYVIGN